MLQSRRFETLDAEKAREIVSACGAARAIYSSVVGDGGRVAAALRSCGCRVCVLDERLPMPLAIDYMSPSTLGHDRIAAAVGALECVPGKNLLVVDAGTAVTLDFITADRHFKGGNIAPGMEMRFRSLSSGCAQLPRIDAEGDLPLVGYDTPTAIRSGVVRGIAAEVAYLHSGLSTLHGATAVVLTGGDGEFVAPCLEALDVVVEKDLVAIGLNRILEYNEL